MATPTLIQAGSGSNTRGGSFPFNTPVTGGGSYDIVLPHPTLSGNCMVVGMTCDNTNTPTITVTDDKGNTYTQIASIVDTTNGQLTVIFAALNLIAGATVLHVSPSTTSSFLSPAYAEFNNVATASAQDGHNSAFSGGGSTSVQPGSFTTTAAGDLIVQYANRNAHGAGTEETWSNSSPWVFAVADRIDGQTLQYQIQASAGAINPLVTLAASQPWATCGIALKSASAGTPLPAGLRIIRLLHHNTQNGTDTSVTVQFPTSVANGLIVVANSGPSQVTAVTDSASNSYTSIGSTIVNLEGAAMFYAKNTTPSNSMTQTHTMSGGQSGSHGSSCFIYEIQGADTTAPLDTTFGTSGFASASGTQATGGAGGNVPTFTATPGAQNELIIIVGSMQADTATGWASPTGAQQMATTYTGENNPANADENNPAGLFFNGVSTAAITPTFTHDTINSAGVGNWTVAGAAFKTAPAGGGGSTPVTTQRVAYGSDGMTMFSNMVG